MSDNFKALILNQDGENFTREVKSKMLEGGGLDGGTI